MTESELQRALDNCNNAPIHAPQYIQPFGAILGIKEGTDKIIFYSENIKDFFDFAEPVPLSLKEIFFDETDRVLDAIKKTKTSSMFVSQKRAVRIIKEGGFSVLELQDDDMCTNTQVHLEFISDITKTLKEANNLEEIFFLLLNTIRGYLGYHRVMLYKFDENFDGEVIAESKEEFMGSFLGHCFPSTDIPESARRLYESSPTRLIEDIGAAPASIIFADGFEMNSPLDMSLVHSRGVAPVHIEYLKNMSVRGSMSISITVEGKLWGLIACHHNEPFYVPLQKRVWCEQASSILSSMMRERELASQNYADSLKNLALVELTKSAFGGVERLVQDDNNHIRDSLLSLIQADGAAILLKDEVFVFGQTPNERQIAEIVSRITSNPESDVTAINSLSSVDVSLEKYHKKASGALLLKISKDKSIIWFRSEITKSISWAGQPIKQFYTEEGRLYISPRKSFETYKEEKRLSCEGWSQKDIFYAKKLGNTLKSVELSMENSEYVSPNTFFSNSFLQVFEVMPQAVVLTDIDANIIYTNKAFADISGYERDEAVGKNTNILRSGVHERSFYADIWSTILALKLWRGQITNRRKDGTLFSVDATIAPLLNQKGEITGYVGIEHEITVLKDEILHTREEVEELTTELENIEKKNETAKIAELANLRFEIKKEMLNQIAHHWRNPLNIISMMFMDLQCAFDDGQLTSGYMRDFGNKISDILQDMSKTIRDFSTYFRPSDSKTKFQICQILSDTISALTPSMQDSGVNIWLSCDEPAFVYGYKSALSTIIVEMINNVKDVKEARNIERADVHISAYLLEGSYIIEISDNCGGIESPEKIFEPYQTTKGVASGLGIGLYHVRVLVENYFNGTIEASNGVLGARFKISIKL